MKRFIVLLIVLVAVPSMLAGIPTRYFTIRCTGGYLHAREGKLWVEYGLTEENKVAPDHWYLGGNSLKSSVGAGHLAYDITGKSNKLFLADTFGMNAEWEIIETRGKTPGDRDEVRGAIRAVNGPMKGWKIDVEEGKLILSKNPSTPAMARRVVLHK